MSADAPARGPMWCESFDMDLPAVIEDARALLGDTADIALWTTGNVTNGVINHPTVWNDERGFIAFFGFHGPARPAFYVTSSPLVQCTFWEAIRDAWPHGYVMLVEEQPVFDAGALWPDFEAIMWDLRGWGDEPRTAQAAAAKSRVRAALTRAAAVIRKLRGRVA